MAFVRVGNRNFAMRPNKDLDPSTSVKLIVEVKDVTFITDEGDAKKKTKTKSRQMSKNAVVQISQPQQVLPKELATLIDNRLNINTSFFLQAETLHESRKQSVLTIEESIKRSVTVSNPIISHSQPLGQLTYAIEDKSMKSIQPVKGGNIMKKSNTKQHYPSVTEEIYDPNNDLIIDQ